jgi:hypothetical protein
MKNIFLFTFFLVCGSVLAQAKKDSTELYYYGARWYNTSPCACYTFPKKDSTYTKKDTLKPTKDFTFVRKKEKKKYFRA